MSDEPLPPLPPPRRLVNVFASEPTAEKVYCTIPAPVFSYFFRHVLAGRRGGPQNLLSVFFLKLYNECLRRGIAEVWDPSNERRVADILADLNFGPDAAPKPRRSTQKRRTVDSPPVSPGQPVACDSNTGTNSGVKS